MGANNYISFHGWKWPITILQKGRWQELRLIIHRKKQCGKPRGACQSKENALLRQVQVNQQNELWNDLTQVQAFQCGNTGKAPTQKHHLENLSSRQHPDKIAPSYARCYHFVFHPSNFFFLHLMHLLQPSVRSQKKMR